MNSRDRVLTALNREEPDCIPLFCQDIMPTFRKRLLKYWGNEYKKDRAYTLYYKDFYFAKKLGYDSQWGFESFPMRLPQGYLNEHPLPQLKESDKFVDTDGCIFMKYPPYESDITWYLTNYIKTEDIADDFYNTYYSVEWEETTDFALKINKKLAKFPTNEFVPCAHLNPILEPLWKGLGLGLVIKLIRKNKSKIKRYIDLRTKIAIEGAKLWAETDFDVLFLCDDTALKNTTMINPIIQVAIIGLFSFLMGYRPDGAIAGMILTFVFMVILSLSSIGFGLITATIAKSAKAAGGIVQIFILPQQIFASGLYPLTPETRIVSMFMPLHYASDALTLLFNGVALSDLRIWGDLMVLIVYSLIIVILGILLFKKYGKT